MALVASSLWFLLRNLILFLIKKKPNLSSPNDQRYKALKLTWSIVAALRGCDRPVEDRWIIDDFIDILGPTRVSVVFIFSMTRKSESENNLPKTNF